jgi:Transglycosylase SLT domain
LPAPVAAGAAALGAARSGYGRRLAAALLGFAALGTMLIVLMVGGLLGGFSGPSGGTAFRPSGEAVADIPAGYLRPYLAAGRRYRLDWAILAGIVSVETDHGRLRAPGVRSGANSAGARGPMQFLEPTFDHYGVDGNHDGRRDIYDPADAIPAAARLLRDNGAPQHYHRAIFAYNHADWYVQDVLDAAARYRGAMQDATPDELARLRANRANARAVLRNPRITLTDTQRADLRSGAIDARLTTVLAALGERRSLVITALKSDHAPGTNHEAGRAADVGAVDGVRCDGSRGGPCADVVVELSRIDGELRPTELIYAWDPDPTDPRDFADPVDHSDHIHIGWDG